MGQSRDGNCNNRTIIATLTYVLFVMAGGLFMSPIAKVISAPSVPMVAERENLGDMRVAETTDGDKTKEGTEEESEAMAEPVSEADPFERRDYRKIPEMAKARDLLIEGMLAGETSIDVSPAGLSKDMVADLYHSILDEEPQMWHASGTCFYISDAQGRIETISPCYLTEDRELIRSMRDEYETAMSRLLEPVPDDASDRDKVVAIHDLLIEACSYNMACYEDPDSYSITISDNPYGAYSAVVQGRTVCRGYSLAFKDACEREGIECEVVRTLTHEWNRVCIDGEWSNVDLTFDDQSNPLLRHRLLLRSDEYLKQYDFEHTTDCPHIGAFPQTVE